MNELTEGIGVLGQLRKHQQELEEIQQILSKAFGYNFIDNTALGLAKEATEKIKELKEEIEELKESVAYYSEMMYHYEDLNEHED